MYQLSESNAGETAVLNCISYLFDREEMPLDFVKIMSSYSVGCYDDMGYLENGDFCENLLFFTASWLADYAKEKHIPLIAKYLSHDDVNLLEIRKCLLAGGCVDLKTEREGRHYITLTKMDDTYIYAFDPYYRPVGSFKPITGVEVVENKPFNYNRKILIEKFISEKPLEYTLGIENYREAILFYRNDVLRSL